MSHTMRTRPVLALVVAAAMLALTACGGDDSEPSSAKGSDAPSSQESAKDQPEVAEPDLDGIPDVVAEVNGEEITKDEFVALYTARFQQVAQQAQMGGEAPDEEALKKQTADSLVDTALLEQEAQKRDISVSDDDVDAELAVLAKQYEMASADDLLAALAEQGTTEDQARDQVETQVRIEQLVADEEGSLEPTGKELRALYAQAKQQQEQLGEQSGQAPEIPPFADVKDQLVEQARSERIGEVAQQLVKQLRKDADIKISL